MYRAAIAIALFAARAYAASPAIDRSDAATLLTMDAPQRERRVEANLLHDGDVVTLDRPLVIHDAAAPARATAKIVVHGASALRLAIEGAPGAVIWVAGSDDAEFERFEASDARWTPTTNGSVVYISIERGELQIAKLSITAAQANGSSSACSRDAACVDAPEFGDAGRAIALLRFVRGDASYVCTGSLVNDSIGSRTGYVLTARHCISNAQEAASIEAVWNFRSESCGSTRAVTPLTRTYGAELLVASAETDVALLRMRKLPAAPVFLDVDPSPVPDGTPMIRLSHAGGATQQFSESVVRTPGIACPSAPPSRYLYSTTTAGAVATGSSGSPLLRPDLRVAGQLLGLCGPLPGDACSNVNATVDGSIAASWPLLAPYLDPPSTRKRSARK